jgi:multiple sugar transport system substrate-binding protein
VSYGGKTWGLPFRPDTRILFYHKAALKDAGLDPAQRPATWDDLWSQSERLTKKGGGGTYAPLGFYPAPGNLWFWTAAWTNGAEFVDAKNVPTLNTRQHLGMLEWYVRWAQRYSATATRR